MCSGQQLSVERLSRHLEAGGAGHRRLTDNQPTFPSSFALPPSTSLRRRRRGPPGQQIHCTELHRSHSLPQLPSRTPSSSSRRRRRRPSLPSCRRLPCCLQDGLLNGISRPAGTSTSRHRRADLAGSLPMHHYHQDSDLPTTRAQQGCRCLQCKVLQA